MKSDLTESGDRELTLEEAAAVLNVSVAYVVGLIERGEIPFRSPDLQPRIKAADLLMRKRREDAETRRVLDELTSEAEKHRLGY
jgi:excisionase family DNA binding protein